MKLQSALLLTASAAIIWGATAPIMKLTLTQVPVFSLAFIRMSLAALILVILISSKLKVKKGDLPMLTLAALTGVTLNLTFSFLGLKLTQAINASFLVAAVPIFTILAAHFYLKEKFNSRLILASLIAFTGVALIIGRPYSSVSSKELVGNFLLLLATLSWVAHEIFAKKLLKTYDGGTIAFYSMALGSFTFLPLALLEFVKSPNWINQVTLSGFMGILYGIFFASLFAYWAWQKGLSLLPASQAAFFFYLDPISGTILAIILLGEKLTPQLAAGGLLIAAGVILVEQKRRTHPLHQ